MKVTQTEIHHYSLNLKQPWMTADGIRISQRNGLLVTLHTDNGLFGTGDCAPFQSLGTEDIETAEDTITELSTQLVGETTDQLLKNLEKIPKVPATKFALECALLDLHAQAKSTPLFRTLGGTNPRIKINANAGNIQSNSSKKVQQLIEDGFSIIKLKVGFQSIEREIALLQQLCEDLPSNIRLRLDANRAWSDSDALQFVHGVSDMPIDTLEEPLETTSLKVLEILQQRAPFDIAVDESLFPLLRIYPFKALPVKRVILKPTILGGMKAALVILRHAQKAGIKTTVTSTLESACGIYCAAHLASASDHINEPSCHGLATSAWFQDNIGEPPIIKQGMMDLSNCIGSGYSLPSGLDA